MTTDYRKPELVCPAGNLPALKAAVDAGGDTVYLGFRNASNARNFEGLNFSREEVEEGIQYAHDRNARVFVAVNTSPGPRNISPWTSSIDIASELGADAVIISDIALLAYAKENHPNLRRHLSVQASAGNYEALEFYAREFGIQRAVLPRILTLDAIREICSKSSLEIEIFASGGLCVMAEGRCWLSSYITGDSPNMNGVCSPAHAVRFEQENGTLDVKLDGMLINKFAPDEAAAYPTLCKGRFEAGGKTGHVMEAPYSLNTLEVLPEIFAAGVHGLKIEGRQRSKHYVRSVVSTWREAVDVCASDPHGYVAKKEWMASLNATSEGGAHTTGAYEDDWR
ncbi:MAG: U32 family peptidase [Mariprofundaceae bacterium]|nr:U32 family peptidase [Mariprofundaceae bacterium]